MTIPISDVTRRVVYSGSAGAGPYSFSFEILDEGDIAVYENDTLLTITTDYTVTINADGTGSVTLVTASTASDTVAILGNKGIERQTDFVTGGDLFASSLNDELDAQTIFAQQNAEAASRAIKIPPQSSLSIDTTLPVPQANYILGWNDDGDAILNLQEIGSYKGTDATTTTAAYNNRDLIKSTTAAQLNNVYICTAASVAGDLLTDTDHFELIIDAVTAATSATNAAASATAAANSATSAQTAQTAAETAETNAETAETNAETAQTAAEAAQTAAEAAQAAAETAETNAETSETNAATSESNASTSETNASTSATAAASSATSAAGSATTATTKASEASTSGQLSPASAL
jgi:chemotaxis protein histidine kinase CheA